MPVVSMVLVLKVGFRLSVCMAMGYIPCLDAEPEMQGWVCWKKSKYCLQSLEVLDHRFSLFICQLVSEIMALIAVAW